MRALIFAALVLGFAAFYPWLEASGICEEADCPQFAQHHAHAELPTATLAAASVAIAASGSPRSFGLHPPPDRRPAQVYLAPDPEPPRP
jgi:ABC-type dipeptide/oligopeptide/nickel transport system permease component